MIAGTVLGFALIYSLVGRMTGVYRLPALDQLGSGRGYLISDGKRWLHVFLWYGRDHISGRESPSDTTTVDSGIWIKEITFVDSKGSLTFHAHTPLDLMDVHALCFGPLSEEIKKLGPNWSEPTVAP